LIKGGLEMAEVKFCYVGESNIVSEINKLDKCQILFIMFESNCRNIDWIKRRVRKIIRSFSRHKWERVGLRVSFFAASKINDRYELECSILENMQGGN
jgi:hypothetical protein